MRAYLLVMHLTPKHRVFNNSTRVIEETCDVEFDESNGSQGDGFCCDDVGKEPLREAMKKMALVTSSQGRMMTLTPFF
jgi:hypothetical protein